MSTSTSLAFWRVYEAMGAHPPKFDIFDAHLRLSRYGWVMRPTPTRLLSRKPRNAVGYYTRDGECRWLTPGKHGFELVEVTR